MPLLAGAQILSLLPETLLYPAHDYKGRTVTTVAEELRFNPRLTKTEVSCQALVFGYPT